MINVRGRWIIALLAMVAVPVWADCGFCGSGGEKKAQLQGHDHAHGEIGKPAPDFALKDVDGKEYKLADFKDKVVVLEWTNYQCPVVNGYHKNKSMRNTLGKFEDKPVAWLAIDSSHFCAEKVDDIKKWSKEIDVEYPILLDAPGQVGHQYGAKTTPHMFVIDQKGVLAYSGALDDDPTGDKDNKRNYVEEAVTALLDGSAVATARTKPVGCSVKYKQ